jgi:hypothetical protein
MNFAPMYLVPKINDYCFGISGPTSFFNPLIQRHLKQCNFDINLKSPFPPIYFVYPRGYRSLGSVYLRVEQMAASLSKTFPFLSILLLTHQKLQSMELKDSIIVLSKASLERLSCSEINSFKKGGNHIVFDCIDGFFPEEFTRNADSFFCSSITEYNFLI